MSLVFDEELSFSLRERGVPGTPIGTLATQPQQNQKLGPPWVYSRDLLTTMELDGGGSSSNPPPSRFERACAAVHADLHRRGYCLLSGTASNGVDFVAYEADPSTVHGCFVVKVLPRGVRVRPCDLTTWSRVSQGVKKDVLLALVDFRVGGDEKQNLRGGSTTSSLREMCDTPFFGFGSVASTPGGGNEDREEGGAKRRRLSSEGYNEEHVKGVGTDVAGEGITIHYQKLVTLQRYL